MRGDERVQDGMFSYVSLEQRIPKEHPLREIRRLTDEVLRSLSAEFDGLYSDQGRPSIAPEYVLRALLLQVFFSVRSERQLVEQIGWKDGWNSIESQIKSAIETYEAVIFVCDQCGKLAYMVDPGDGLITHFD
jgi:hypothetical protein